jgi:hypothetical protein
MSWLQQIWAESLNTERALEELKIDAAKKEVLTATAEREAKVAQELAIAERITTALEVTIEEFYEYKGEGAIGTQIDGTKLNIGASGSGQRVSRRIYKFSGLATAKSDVAGPGLSPN